MKNSVKYLSCSGSYSTFSFRDQEVSRPVLNRAGDAEEGF
jgi:hypothetical protein